MYLFIQIIAVMISVYYLIISVSGLVYENANKHHLPQKRFALIIPAHNEETVIGNMIESLKNLNYPGHLYDIFVVADNCTDHTASVAKNEGAFVFERTNTAQTGKGHALQYIFNKLLASDQKYDAVAIFDADNIVSRNFLIHMNNQLCEGKKVIQGYIESKNPFDSWVTCTYSICFWTLSRLYQLSRYQLGLSCNLWGTGFVIDTQILREIGWDVHCLTEDLEFTLKLVLNNYKVAWEHKAVVYDEKPLTLSQSWVQRKRWMQGHSNVADRYLSKLLDKAYKDQDWSALDFALYLLQPVRITAACVVTLMAYLQTAYPNGIVDGVYIEYLFPFPHVWYFFLFLQFVYPTLLVLIERKFDWKVMLGYLMYPVFNFTYGIIAIQGMIDKNKKEWAHTVHNRNIRLKDLEF
ncbi:MAG: glycosyltransferase [Firmicutes bacterium]|nr:glycosyltransferase [Bacillota bacterium]